MTTLAGPFLNLPLGSPGGISVAYGIAAAGSIIVKPCVLFTLASITGTAITILDGEGGNEVCALSGITAGALVPLYGWPCGVGVYVSAITGTFNLAFS